MIQTVTFNPAVDKTALVDVLVPGGLNRLRSVRQDAGGKGINVSKALQALGMESVCTGFVGGSAGDFICAQLDACGIAHDFVRVSGQTRTNLKVLDKDMCLTEFNEAGPCVDGSDVAALLDKVCGDLVILSGNAGPGVQPSVYASVIEKVRSYGGRVVLDADGELFAAGLSAGPAVIKPNRHELAQYFAVDEDLSVEEVIGLAGRLLNEATWLAVVSLGADGAVFVTAEQVLVCAGLSVDFRSSVGAGDAMVAAIAYALENGLSLEELAVLAVAVSAGACMTDGTCPASMDVVESLQGRVVVEHH